MRKRFKDKFLTPPLTPSASGSNVFEPSTDEVVLLMNYASRGDVEGFSKIWSDKFPYQNLHSI